MPLIAWLLAAVGPMVVIAAVFVIAALIVIGAGNGGDD